MGRLQTQLSVNTGVLKEASEALAAINPTQSLIPADVRRQMVIKAADDNAAWQALSSEIIPRVRLNVLADTMAMDFFQYYGLEDGQMPEYVAESDMPTGVTVISEQGGVASQVWTGTQNITNWNLYMLASKDIYVPLMSLRHGNIDQMDTAKARAAYDMDQKLDVDLFTILTAGLGAFPATTWILDSRIKDTPTTNDLDWSVALGGELKKDFFSLLFDHFNRLGLSVNNIYVPTTIPKTMWSWVSVTSGFDGGSIQPGDTIDPVTQREIMTNGAPMQAFGQRFNLVPKNILDGTTAGSKYVWVSTSQPAGMFFENKNLARNWNKSDREPFFRGFGSMMTIGQGMPDPWKPRYARIKIG